MIEYNVKKKNALRLLLLWILVSIILFGSMYLRLQGDEQPTGPLDGAILMMLIFIDMILLPIFLAIGYFLWTHKIVRILFTICYIIPILMICWIGILEYAEAHMHPNAVRNEFHIADLAVVYSVDGCYEEFKRQSGDGEYHAMSCQFDYIGKDPTLKKAWRSARGEKAKELRKQYMSSTYRYDCYCERSKTSLTDIDRSLFIPVVSGLEHVVIGAYMSLFEREKKHEGAVPLLLHDM